MTDKADEPKRLGDWFQTDTGIQFYPLDPRIEEVRIWDIARALSKICRFGGHCTTFYSVAQHSIIVSEIVPESIALEGLLHDAAEAYIGDMIRPLKLSMPEYVEVEKRIEPLIAERFRCIYPWPPEIKQADNIALMTERRDLLRKKREWTCRADPLPKRIVALAWDDAELAFIQRFVRLWDDRKLTWGGM